jgi:hypothetical protein
LRIPVLAAALAAFAAPALAGQPYVAPRLQPAEAVEPSAGLRSDAIALLKAVRAGDLEAVSGFIAPQVTVVSGALDMSLPRHIEKLGPGSGRGAVAELGNHTGGDWDLPPDVDIGEFLADMELDFIEGALTDGQPWGTDPLLPGTVCTYGFHDFDPMEVKRAAAALGSDAGSFVMVDEGAPVLDAPDGKALGALSATRLYATDYDIDVPAGWMAIHRPEGGTGFIAVGEDGLQKPYASGICFAKGSTGWQLVGQASTGL